MDNFSVDPEFKSVTNRFHSSAWREGHMYEGLRIAVNSAVVVTLLSVSISMAQKTSQTVQSAPPPSQIFSGRTVFISYAGIATPAVAKVLTKFTGDPNGYYDQFYAAIKNWGRYQLVSAPGDSDLVFEIFLDAPSGYLPRLRLRIIDPKTHIILWSFFEEFQLSPKDWERKLAKLVDDARIAVEPVGQGTGSKS
jgi:hypothetical protein